MTTTNTLGVVLKIQTALRAAIWTGGSEKVFATESVIIAGDELSVAIAWDRLPIAIIRVGDASVDPEYGEQSDLLEQEIVVTLASAVHGDGVGENSIVGANRVGGTTSSQNRGLLELEFELQRAIQFLGVADAILIQHVAAGAAAVAPLDENRIVRYRDYRYKTWTTTQ